MNDDFSNINIVQVNTLDGRGGAGTSAWNLHANYRNIGLNSYLVVGEKTNEHQDEHTIVLDHSLYAGCWSKFWHSIRSRSRGTSFSKPGALLGKLGSTNRVRQIIAEQRGHEYMEYPATVHILDMLPERQSIIHCHNLHGGYFDLRALPALSKRAPVVLNLRDAWLLSGHCAHSYDCERWRTGCGSCPYLDTYPKLTRDGTKYNWKRKKSIYSRSRLYVTAPSDWMLNRAKESMLQAVQYRTIPNAIDLNVYKPIDKPIARREIGLPKDCNVVLIMAQNEFKDITAMKRVLAELKPVSGFPLLFLCLGPKMPEEQIGCGLLKYIPYQTDVKKMATYYSASDVYLHIAKAEVFGKSVAESMACGTPVVVSATGGLPEVVKHGFSGLVVSSDDTTAYARIVQNVVSDEKYRDEIGKRASAYAHSEFSMEKQIKQFIAYYAEVLEDWRSAS